ncbi:ribonuclease domain-containing protein [Kribbella sp.]|uniref:ribonuclease domain-containing protein n=1 Tax=Kribbella sp. TaxID=1871183 RepID=UPI002D3B60CF|nr:ribonuclease domain-containing protein [Kribbella sp.]HZX03908.1 ribonuclease domain-containing protein [Kribbella sp.]
MRTLIAAVTLATTAALGSTAYAAPTAPISYVAPHRAAAIDTCALSSLPSQAADTLGLIHSGGPFPYKQDGTVFSNREGILPSESSGYYHEYTVITPGSPDRGARRLIGGGAKTTPAHVYYTSDHYASFCEVDENS